jgi:predicted Rossmann fold flavoprotein
MKQIIVIGGGAAGMMAAISASMAGAAVTLLEKNEKLGKKLYITGKGRCNLTNSAPMEEIQSQVVSNPKFLYGSFSAFTNEDLCRMIREAGCPLKEERGGRMFPVSDHSSDVIAALRRILERGGVDIMLHREVKQLLTENLPAEEGAVDGAKEGKGYVQRVTGVKLSDGTVLKADAVILATGGLSYPVTGSTGDGMDFAAKLGMKVTECRPSLVPFICKEPWCRDLAGLSLKNVGFRLVNGKRTLYDGFGEMLFTHTGISGPLVLSASCFYGKRKTEDVCGILDLKPALTEEQLDHRILRDFEEQQNKDFTNSLGGLLPSGLIPVVVEMSGIPAHKKVHEITRAERQGLVQTLKGLTLHVTGTASFAEAIITQGGISVKEVNPSTMESRKVRGLYPAGEVLDLDALTGGFNLQIAWSTGFLAGREAARSEEADEI